VRFCSQLAALFFYGALDEFAKTATARMETFEKKFLNSLSLWPRRLCRDRIKKE
jgi:hypothetical protein